MPGYLVDLLAAIPSIVFGLGGIFVSRPATVPVMRWLEDLGFMPIFKGPASVTGRTMFVAGLVLAVMMLPILSAVTARSSRRRPASSRKAPRRWGDPLGDDPDVGPPVGSRR